uniref:Protein TIFY n=1 Tax=Anthurium amnicola TaxID=1678845 RepID=A0A1D1YMR8_9ARAE
MCEGDMDCCLGKDAPADMASQMEQPEHRHHQNGGRQEGERAEEEEEAEASKMADRGEGNKNRLPAASPLALASNPTQLTIFYNGAICVYDAISPEKVEALILLAAATAAAAGSIAASTTNTNKSVKCPVIAASPAAAAGATAAMATAAPVASPVLTRSPSLLSSSVAAAPVSLQNQQLLPNTGSSLCKLQAELPLARRHSLQRFLEKRRDRLVSRAPYPPMKTSDSPGNGTGSEASTPSELY